MRLPQNIRDIGDVTISGPRPPGPHSLAHRLSYYIARKDVKVDLGQGHMDPKPKCLTAQQAIDAGQSYAELSARRADELDVPACLTCFPEV